MTATVIPFPGTAGSMQPAQLEVTRDDYATKVACRGDRRYWVRVENDHAGTLAVTDFARGDRSERDLLEGLRLAVGSLDTPLCSRIVFRDIVPGGMSAPHSSFHLKRTSECVKRGVRALAQDRGRTIAAFETRERGGKIDVLATLS